MFRIHIGVMVHPTQLMDTMYQYRILVLFWIGMFSTIWHRN